MVFSSVTFLLFFFPLFLVLYYLADARYKNAIVLLFSTFFYGWGAPQFVFILLGSTFLDFYLVKWMHQQPDIKKKRGLLALSIILNLGLLAYFKYANFFVDNVNSFFGKLGMGPIKWTDIILPIGISFYTFQTLTYSIDVYRKVQRPLERVWDYLLYIIMFPQLIAGPIVRFNAIADQLRERNETNEDRVLGFYRFCIGLAKKVLIANVMGAKADALMGADIAGLNSTEAWIGIIAYTFQIYFDFSGYSDMAIGIGRMIGFKFPENFDSPYCSKSITEFWRRWHITLGTWMRDYLYIPLGGSRVNSKARLYGNLWSVFIISGLWHGASWNFVAWGAFHGFFLVLERQFLSRLLQRTGQLVSLLYTLTIVMLGWVVFRIEDMGEAWLYYKRLFAFDFGSISIGSDPQFYSYLLIATFFSFFMLLPKAQRMQGWFYGQVYSTKSLVAGFFVFALLFALSLGAITTSNFNPFIYFRF